MARIILNLFSSMFILTKSNIFCIARVNVALEKLQHGYRLERKMINSFTGYSLFDCMGEYIRTKRCKSVGYYRGASYCEVYFENRVAAPDKFVHSNGWIYSDRNDWEQGIDGHCSTANCGINQKCSSSLLGKTVCVLSANDIWLGGTDHVAEGRWTWIYNNSKGSFSYWIFGEPNDSVGTLNCVILKQKDGLWYDRSCDEAHAYVCEQAQSEIA